LFQSVLNDVRVTFPAAVNSLAAGLQAIRSQIEGLNFIPRHGQDLDEPVGDWDWRDIALSRRTGAFVTNLVKQASASGSARQLSFAFGALSAYGANVVGSSYINGTAGGSRRSHGLRFRTASYTVGSYLLQQLPTLTMPLATMRTAISFGSPNSPALPSELNDLLMAAAKVAYNKPGLPALPDFRAAYKNLMEHLRLLDSFGDLPVPTPIDSTLQQQLDTLYTQSDPPYGPSPSSQQGSGFTFSSIPKWADVLTALCFIFADLNYWEETVHPATGIDPYITDNEDSLTTTAGPFSVDVLFKMHCSLYDLAASGRSFLARTGLLYPTTDDLLDPTFQQFLSLPASSGVSTFPHQRLQDASLFLTYPTTPVEDPATSATQFMAGDLPTAIIEGSSGARNDSVAVILSQLWGNPLGNREASEENLNLDADRGYGFSCWALAAGTSINDDPVVTTVLGYGDV
jgi:hypothetical protein